MTDVTQQTLLQAFPQITSIDKEDLLGHAHDESIFVIEPKVVMTPRSTGELADIIRTISQLKIEDESLSITVRAAATGLSGGSLNDSVIIDITPHLHEFINMTINEDPDKNSTITVQTGMLYKHFEDILDDTNYTMPIFPSSREWCAIGGMLGNNAAGENTLKYGSQDGFVSQLKVILDDGIEYIIKPQTYQEAGSEIESGGRLGVIYKEIIDLYKKHEELIVKKPTQASKNVSGYALWKIFSHSYQDFVNGNGTIDLTKIFIGAQGTLGIITEVTYALMERPIVSDTLVIPVADTNILPEMLTTLLKQNPEKIELFDRRTFDLLKKYPEDVRSSFFTTSQEYTKFLDIFTKKIIPEIEEHDSQVIILAQVSDTKKELADKAIHQLKNDLQYEYAFISEDDFEERIYWALRYSSLALIAKHSEGKKPAAFLEDLVMPVEHIASFYKELYEKIESHDLHCAVHGHAGNVHLHFYPLIDFTKEDVPQKIVELCNDFFQLAQKYDGSLSGEHNDGLIRTPYLHLMYSNEWIDLFEKTKDIFDPKNIFNPGKKVYPRYDIKDIIRKDNDAGYFQTK